MSKSSIHPDYHEITIVLTDGSKIKTRSTYGKPGSEIHLDVDPFTHSAWKKDGDGASHNHTGATAKFIQKFGNLKILGSTS